MKFIVILISAIIIGAERIKIHTTGPPKAKMYNFFPLRTKYIEFNVKSDRDINIMLCNQFSYEGPYYEIVIGATGNKISFMKKIQVVGNYAVQHNQGMVTKNEYQTFWVAMNDTEESISVGKSFGRPFLFLQDPNYIKMTYFGISSAYGSEADWDFDEDIFKWGDCS